MFPVGSRFIRVAGADREPAVNAAGVPVARDGANLTTAEGGQPPGRCWLSQDARLKPLLQIRHGTTSGRVERSPGSNERAMRSIASASSGRSRNGFRMSAKSRRA